MSVALNYSRRVMTRKTWALRLLTFSFLLSTAVAGHATCQQISIYILEFPASLLWTVGSCSKDASCCIQSNDKCLKLDHMKCTCKNLWGLCYDFECHIYCLKPVCPNTITTSTTNLPPDPTSSTPTCKGDEHRKDASLSVCKTAGIVGALVAFILGVIVGLLVVCLKRRKCSNSLEESPATTVMPEMINTRREHKDQQEASGNHCEDRNVYSLAKVLNLPSDITSALQSETSNILNEQDSSADVYCHLRVVSEAGTREYTPLTPPDQKNSLTAPPAVFQQMLVSQNLPSIDEAGYSRVADTARAFKRSEPLRHQSAAFCQARSPSPLELSSDDAGEYNRLDRHDNQNKALAGDDNYQHLQTIATRRDNPVSGGYELATVTTDVRDKTKETETAQSFNILEKRGGSPKRLSGSPSASDDHQEERLKDSSLTDIERHVYFELEPPGDLSQQGDNDEGHNNNNFSDDAQEYSSPHNPDIRRFLEQPCEESYRHLQDAHPAEVFVSSDYELAKIISDKDPS